MKSIGGNKTAVLQRKTIKKNEIGAKVESWVNVEDLNIRGWLDYTSGDGSYKSNFKGDVEETTNIFVGDYVDNVDRDIEKAKRKPSLYRLKIDNDNYDILKVDDPMELHSQLEIYLKYSEVMQ